jgi:3-methyladenine DNA glycosylase/8-oxoguanine DNA glycosylase
VTQPKRPKAKRPRERYDPYRDYAAAYPWYGGYRRSSNYAFQGYGGYRPF